MYITDNVTFIYTITSETHNDSRKYGFRLDEPQVLLGTEKGVKVQCKFI